MKQENNGWKGLLPKKKKKLTTAQQSIPYLEMFQDGICQVTETYYTKTVQFYDINYQLAQNEDKAAIFSNYCGFLNYFDSSVKVQLSFINQQMNAEEFAKTIDIPYQEDGFQDIRQEYATMLKNQLSKGNNGLVKTNTLPLVWKQKALKMQN